MAVPKKRTTKSARNRRRANIFLKAPSLSICSKCGKLVSPHTVCFNCGYYKGVQVIDVMKKLNKKEAKAKAKEIGAKEEAAKAEAKQEKALGWEELSKK